ncbi:MAG: universal stress protein [Cyanobacteriota bacterium]|nr:universal stress protein [Cyanobacteriota bacterium]
MYHKILVPLDGSPQAEAVLPYVQQFAQTSKAHIILTHVVEPKNRSRVVNLKQAKEVTYVPQKLDSIQAYLESWKNHLEDQKISTEILLLQGIAVDSILEAAHLSKADLVAMATQGRTGLAEVFHGSITAGVMNRLKCPSFIIHSPRASKTTAQMQSSQAELVKIQRILIALDGSQQAEQVIPHIAEMATAYQAKILLLRVVRTGYQITALGEVEQPEQDEKFAQDFFGRLQQEQEYERVQTARSYLLELRSSLQEQDLEVEAYLMYGRPIESIIKLAQETQTDVVAITNQVRTGLSQVFYGSVAAGILNNSTYPLLVVPSR